MSRGITGRPIPGGGLGRVKGCGSNLVGRLGWALLGFSRQERLISSVTVA